MLICHSCGTPVESKSRQCHHCRNAISAHAAVGLMEPEAGSPLKVQLELQPRTLDNLIAADLIKAASKYSSSQESPSITPVLEKSGNGGDGHNGENTGTQDSSPGNDKSDKEVDFFARLPDMFRKNTAIQEESIKDDIDWQAGTPALPINTRGEQTFPQTGDQIMEPGVEGPVADRIIENSPVSQVKAIKRQEGLKSSASPTAPPKSDNNGENGDADGQVAASATGVFDDINTGVAPNKEDSLITSLVTSDVTSPATSPQANPVTSSVTDPVTNPVTRRSFTDQKQSKTADFNLKSSWPQLLALGVVAAFLLFKGFEVFYAAGNSILANSGNLAAVGGQANGISGRWQFAARWHDGSCQGQMVMHQRDKQLYGEGVDNGLSQYKFNGSRSGDHIDLVKQYFVSTGFIGHPIRMQGDLEAGSKPGFMHGEFVIDYMQGGKWRGKPVVINGIWEAEMIQPLIEDENSASEVPVLHKYESGSSSSMGAFANYLAKNGIWIVLIGAAVGWGAWHTMSSLIGPDGWFGIWDKQKYVPPQFMSDHRKEKKQLSRPLTVGSLPLGQRWEWHFWQKYFFWIPKDLAIPPDVRANNPHVLLLGGGEKGKSRLMAGMIVHDIESADRAVVVVDSDGDLADLLLRWIAAHADGQQLAKRVIVIDPTANTPSPSFNPLELADTAEMQNAASAIVHGFKAIYHEAPGSQNQWSQQTAHILRNAAMLLMANGKTLIDLPTLLQDNDFRDIMLEKIEKRKSEKVEFATLLETWSQYKRLARTEQWINWAEPILNRVGATLTNLRIRPILTQAQGDINLKQVITDKKILIVKIPKGQLHDDANLLGSLIVTGLKQAAITLCTEGKVTDRTAALYLDEFDNFIEKETLDAITTETKKFQLGFVGSTKTLQHMPEDFRNQIVINIGTMCVFALSKKDGDMIGPQMFRVSGRKAKHRTLMNLLNKVNTSPQFELISDEEKYNIDRILGQTERHFYAYRVGTVAGTFRMKCHDFNDIPDDKADKALLESMYKNR